MTLSVSDSARDNWLKIARGAGAIGTFGVGPAWVIQGLQDAPARKAITPNSRTCSPECKSEVFRRAAGKRIAAKAGEPTDFVAREGSGAMLTRHDVVAQYGLSVGQVHRLPPRDGRSGGLPWWWESTVIEWRSRMDAARSRPLDAYRRGRT